MYRIGTGLRANPVPGERVGSGELKLLSTAPPVALYIWSYSYLSRTGRRVQWRRNMQLTNWLHMAYSGHSDGSQITHGQAAVQDTMPKHQTWFRYVGGTLISVNASNNPAYGNTQPLCSICCTCMSISYQITSYPTENTSCGAGCIFSIWHIKLN